VGKEPPEISGQSWIKRIPLITESNIEGKKGAKGGKTRDREVKKGSCERSEPSDDRILAQISTVWIVKIWEGGVIFEEGAVNHQKGYVSPFPLISAAKG